VGAATGAVPNRRPDSMKLTDAAAKAWKPDSVSVTLFAAHEAGK
jgi:hypothetical protein